MTYCYIRMNVVGFARFVHKATGQLIDAGIQYPEALVVLRKDALQRLDLQLERVQARHDDALVCVCVSVLLGRLGNGRTDAKLCVCVCACGCMCVCVCVCMSLMRTKNVYAARGNCG